MAGIPWFLEADLGKESGGFWHIPVLEGYVPQSMDRIIGFRQARNWNAGTLGIGAHFYLCECFLERLWKRPGRQLDTLRKFEFVISPDFPVNENQPAAVNLWNHYRKMAVAQFWQRNGIRVVPTLNWANASSWEFCFDGIPKGGAVSVSTVGVMRNVEARKTWIAGMEEAVRRIQPEVILIFGSPLDFDAGKAEIRRFQADGRKCRVNVGPRTQWLLENERAILSWAARLGIPKGEWEDFRQDVLLKSLTVKDGWEKGKGAGIAAWAGNLIKMTAREWFRNKTAQRE